MEPWLFPNTCVGVILALVTLEGRPVVLGYREADLSERELSKYICSDIVHVIAQNGLGFLGDSTFFLTGGV